MSHERHALTTSERRRLRAIAEQDQQAAAKRDGHRCSYECDCESWYEQGKPASAREEATLWVVVAIGCAGWLLLVSKVAEWLAR